MASIASLLARQILDSRGNPTIEVDCVLDDGSHGRASVPSGVSAGVHEAIELRDGDKKIYGGKSVFKAVGNVTGPIAKALMGKAVSDQRTIDQLLIDLDGTKNKGKLGANAILGASMAVCRARAASEEKTLWQSLADQFEVTNASLLPMPMMVILEGGAHSDCGLALQENMIVPIGFSSFSDALRAGSEIFHALQRILAKDGHVTAVGIEGGFAPRLETCEEALSYIEKAIDAAGYTGKVKIAIDAAASEFRQKDGTYAIDGKHLSREELTSYFVELCTSHPIVSIEDSHGEDDWEGFIAMKQKLGKTVQLVGDDLLVTNVARIREASEKDAVNAVLIKVNQIGSVSETVDAIQLTQQLGWHPIVSHRGGDTEDDFIAHLAVGLRTGQIKTGSLSRGERICKYNALLRIEEELGKKARYENPF